MARTAFLLYPTDARFGKVLVMQVRALLIVTALAACLCSTAFGQFKQGDAEGAKLGDAREQRVRIGVIVKAVGGACSGIVAHTVVPTDWPEQEVKVIEEDVTSTAKVSYQMVDGMAKAMEIRIPSLPSGEEARAVVTLEVRRSQVLPPEDTDQYVVPEMKKLDRMARICLAPSPKIESRDRKIRSLAKEIAGDKEKAWERVETIYDWVRDKVKYKKNCPLRGALVALKEEEGDCEDLTSLFVALCRASDIPARTVWVEGHCYPEFLLMDKQGQCRWFPCEIAGSRVFGGIAEFRPVLQKGDNVHPPSNRREAQRYLADNLVGAGGRPQVKFVREKVSQ